MNTLSIPLSKIGRLSERKLLTFRAVVNGGFIAGAASVLGVTESAVSFHIRQLESHFKTQLLHRDRGECVPTLAGASLLKYSNRIADIYADLMSSVDEVTGKRDRQSLHIGASKTIAESVLPQILGQFSTMYPSAKIYLSVGKSADIEAGVAERSLDLGLVEGNPPGN